MILLRCLKTRAAEIVVAAVLSVTLSPMARAFDPTPAEDPNVINVAVRSQVEKPLGWKPHDAPKHGKSYFIISVKEIKLEEKLVRPVDERGMYQAIQDELAAHGFKEIKKGETPEVVITIDYGRGYIKNTYMADVMSSMEEPPTVTMSGAWAIQLNRQREAGFETKMRRAQFEKLYIIMSAWKYPPKAKKRPELAWKTTMLLDNPANVDLNLVYKQMIAAGGPFFDQEMKDEEAFMTKPLREGNVEIGTPSVVEPKTR